MVSQALQRFCDGKAGIAYIPPGYPWANGYTSNSTTVCARSASTATTGTPCSRPAWSGDFKHEHNHRPLGLAFANRPALKRHRRK
jgi:putative transposase